MAGEITVNTAQVAATGISIQTKNTTFKDTLEKAKTSVDSLKNSWQSPSADSIIPIFNVLAGKHFDNSYDTVNRYTEFLKTNIAQGYDQTETANILLADEF